MQRVNFIHVRFSIDFTGYSPDFDGFCAKRFCRIDNYAMRVQKHVKFEKKSSYFCTQWDSNPRKFRFFVFNVEWRRFEGNTKWPPKSTTVYGVSSSGMNAACENIFSASLLFRLQEISFLRSHNISKRMTYPVNFLLDVSLENLVLKSIFVIEISNTIEP